MTTRRRRPQPGGAAAAARRRHAWLELVQPSGPFLTLPVVDRVWPNGIPPVATGTRAALRSAVAQMLDTQGGSRQATIVAVLCELLGWGDHLRLETDLPDTLAEPIPEHHTTVRPTFAFVTDADEGTGDADDADEDNDEGAAGDHGTAGPYRLLGITVPWGTHPLSRTSDGGWTANAVERLAVLLRARDTPVGIATDGRWWAIVSAPKGGTTGAAVWDASLWSEEPESLAAFTALLDRARFLAAAPRDRLPKLLTESLGRQEELTENLSVQVRESVELLVLTLDRLDAESGAQLLADVDDDAIYSGAVTVMMRIVFLLFAEERGLLRSDADGYLRAYSIARLVEQLEQRAALAGEQTLEHRTGAWHRLLALSRAVHGGVAHEDLRLPAYGGGLFDPDRHPWLEGRKPGDPAVAARPPAVDDRTMLQLLRAVQYVNVAGERRRLTFRALDVEQIGYVYEGLLELEVRTASEPVLQLHRVTSGKNRWPKQKAPAEVTLSTAAEWTELSTAQLVSQLTARTGLTAKRLQTALTTLIEEEIRADLRVRLGEPADVTLIEIAGTLSPVMRRDDRDRPVVTRPGRRYLAPSTRRSATGTHYTPRWLAEDVATHALEPLCYRPGPLETGERDTWEIRPSTELLDLRIADIAMGSGAFLVAACRYMGDRLVEAWQAEGRTDAQTAIAARQSGTNASDVEVDDVVLDARRLIAEHCLYGVDINPLAVDMAKLSLWLITMDDQRPFGFLDDRLVCGDSLLGLASWAQLDALHVDPVLGRRDRQGQGMFDFTGEWRSQLDRAADIRRRITAQPVNEIRDVQRKQRLLAEATALTEQVQLVADTVTARGLEAAGLSQTRTRDRFTSLRAEIGGALDDPDEARRLQLHAAGWLQDHRPEGTDPRRPLHWPLAFPEVFVDSRDPGFDAIIGNPPFLGGQKHREALGADYMRWMQRWDGNGTTGSADLAARFVLRAERLLSTRGQLGFITTNTLVQGATLEVGMLQATAAGGSHPLTVRRGRSSHPWPSRSASLEIVGVWASKARLAPSAVKVLDNEVVPAIGADLELVGRVAGRPVPLPENDGIAFQGSNVLGLGFTMTPDEAAKLIAKDPRNAEALQPYVIGQDLNKRPDSSASRWIVNFRDWPLERAERYPDLIDIVRRLVKPDRDRNNRKQRRDRWWMFAERASDLYGAIDGLEDVLAISLVGNALLPVRVPTGQVFAHKCAVFALDDFASVAVLSSSIHQTWVTRYTSTLETRINYSPSDVFDTLPRPERTPGLELLGQRLDTERRELMLARGWGLTTTYNHVHDPVDTDPAIVNLREIHEAIDHAVLDAYGWDLDPQIGHHPTKIGTRWTVSPAARFELLDLLLEENHRRTGLL